MIDVLVSLVGLFGSVLIMLGAANAAAAGIRAIH
jgi:hypothetical protein